MSELYFALPDHLAEFVQAQVAEGGYAGVGEYVVQLVETERRRKVKSELEAELLRGIRSGSATEMTADDWRRIREQVEQRLGSPLEQ